MLFKNLNLHKRLYLTLGILIFMIFILGEWSIWQSSKINQRVNDIYTQEVIPLENISHLKGALYRIRDRSLRLVDTSSLADIEHHKQIIKEQIERINKELNIYDNTRLSKEELKELEKFKRNLKQYISIIETKVYPNLLDSNKIDLEQLLYKNSIIEFREAREALNKLSEYQIKRAKLRYFHSNKIFTQQIIVIQSIILLIVLLSIFFAKSLMKSIIAPIKHINKVLSNITHENFSETVNVNSQDELGEMSNMLNHSIKMLQKTFSELSMLTYYDTLTNLPNRKKFQEQIDQHINNETSKQFAVIFIDVDNFKQINDIYGHTIGDKLLEVISRKIRQYIRQQDFIARLGGDEFALLIDNIKTPTVPGNIANKIIDSFQQPIYIDNHIIFTSVSIGIYVSTNTNESREQILSYSDVAMQEAKKTGKAKYIYFNQGIHQKIEEELFLTNDLHKALKNNEFKVYFQPIMDPKSGTLYSVETLLRWHKGSLVITPDKFITKMESNGMILELTYMIIQNVFDMIQKNNFKSNVSINLSVLQFFDKNFIPFLKNILQEYPNINPSKIYFEITESVLVQNNDLVYEMMNLIKQLGFNFSLDDFGTGYSSLFYLKDYPINTIKIDRSFIKDILEDTKSQSLLDGIIYLANTLGLVIIVEGVEDKATFNLITQHKNIKIQGYYFYKPMKQQEFENLLQ